MKGGTEVPVQQGGGYIVYSSPSAELEVWVEERVTVREGGQRVPAISSVRRPCVAPHRCAG